jgi:hypothetical protein
MLTRLAFTLLSVAAPLSLAQTSCTSDGAGDGRDDVAVPGGKADDSEFTSCQLDAVVSYLASASAADLEAAGVSAEAAAGLLAHRDGADGVAGTDDDDRFDDIAEVDAIDFVGLETMRALVATAGAACAEDPYAQARDVTLARITFPDGTPAPSSYQRPTGGAGLSLGGTEFWQRWSGGLSPTFNFGEGTEAGRRCMQASAIRWGVIMANPPAEIVALDDESNWGGSFFNWNDDHSLASYDGSGPRLWAWRTGLIKWISQTNRDGSCNLPTLEMVQRLAVDCRARAAGGGGEIQGCSAR